MSKDIFVSHAAKDKPLADAVVDLLVLGLNVHADQVFCSSLEGLGIPPGEDFLKHIKEQIQTPRAVVALITPNYLASQFCLCELGAVWAMSHRVFPLLVEPLTHSDIKGVLQSVQQTSIHDGTQWSNLKEVLGKQLDIVGAKAARWEVKRDDFLKRLPGILSSLPNSDVVSAAAHAKVQEDLAGAKESIAELDLQIEQLKALNLALSKAKDKKEVDAIEAAALPENDRYKQLESELSAASSALPKAVAFVACHQLGLRQEVGANSANDPDYVREIGEAHDRKLVRIDPDGSCALNVSHPKVRPVVAAFEKLTTFLDFEASSALSERFEDTHRIPLALDNREYWERALDKRIRFVNP